MGSIFSHRAEKLQQGGIRAFFDKASAYPDAIQLSIGEPDLNTPAPIIDSAYAAMCNGKTHYTANAGTLALRESIALYLDKQGIKADPESEIIVTCGGMGAVFLAIMCLVDAGDEVLIQDPQWVNYRSQVSFAGGIPVPVPVYEQDGFVMQPEEIKRRITPRTKLLMLNSPNNPTGAVLDMERLKEIAEIAARYGLFVLSDEVYSELLYDGIEHCSMAALPGMKERTLVINSFSKSFAMTGWRLGYACGPRNLVKKMTILQENVSACAPAPAQFAAIDALKTMCQVEEMRALYARRRDVLIKGLNEIPGITCHKPAGAFYAFPNISALMPDDEKFATLLLEKARVVTVPGSCFGEAGRGYLRIAYSNSIENIEEALRRMKILSETLRTHAWKTPPIASGR